MMVFAPTHDLPLEPHEPATAPRRPDHVAPPSTDRQTRLAWRAVVRVLDRDTVRTTWHLAGCTAPLEPSAHCPHGQRLIETMGDPDGHCLVRGHCRRCASAN